MTQRDNLVAFIKRQKSVDGLIFPVVSLEKFFEGNEDYGSIGCNLDVPYALPVPSAGSWRNKIKGLWGRPGSSKPPPVPTAPHPGPQGFYQVLQGVRARANVQDVLVEIAEFYEDGSQWPFSERVYILAKASVEEVEIWLESLFPDTVEEGYPHSDPSSFPEISPGHQVFTAWWD